MKIKEIKKAIKELSKSQVFYGRMLEALEMTEMNDPDRYTEVVKNLEAQNFKDAVDMVMYFEGC